MKEREGRETFDKKFEESAVREVLEAFEVGDHCFQQVKEFDLSCGLFSVFSSSAATLLETFRAGNASFPTTTKLSLIGRSFPA